jgi:hypothetical protein
MQPIGTSPLYRAMLVGQLHLAHPPQDAMADEAASQTAAEKTHTVCRRYPNCECCVKTAPCGLPAGKNTQHAFLIPPKEC